MPLPVGLRIVKRVSSAYEIATYGTGRRFHSSELSAHTRRQILPKCAPLAKWFSASYEFAEVENPVDHRPAGLPCRNGPVHLLNISGANVDATNPLSFNIADGSSGSSSPCRHRSGRAGPPRQHAFISGSNLPSHDRQSPYAVGKRFHGLVPCRSGLVVDHSIRSHGPQRVLCQRRCWVTIDICPPSSRTAAQSWKHRRSPTAAPIRSFTGLPTGTAFTPPSAAHGPSVAFFGWCFGIMNQSIGFRTPFPAAYRPDRPPAQIGLPIVHLPLTATLS